MNNKRVIYEISEQRQKHCKDKYFTGIVKFTLKQNVGI